MGSPSVKLQLDGRFLTWLSTYHKHRRCTKLQFKCSSWLVWVYDICIVVCLVA
jgi:hypothetical protein